MLLSDSSDIDDGPPFFRPDEAVAGFFASAFLPRAAVVDEAGGLRVR